MVYIMTWKTDEHRLLIMKFDTIYVLFCCFRLIYVANFGILATEFSGNEFYHLFIMKDKGKTDRCLAL